MDDFNGNYISYMYCEWELSGPPIPWNSTSCYDYDGYITVHLSPTLKHLIYAWLAVNTLEVAVILLVLARKHCRRAITFDGGGVRTDGFASITLCRLVRSPRSWTLLGDVSVLVLLWILIAAQEDDSPVRVAPLVLPLFRGPSMASRIPGFWTPLKVVARSRVVRFSIPILVWMYLMAAVGTFCFSTVDGLEKYFGDLGHSIKTVIQIMSAWHALPCLALRSLGWLAMPLSPSRRSQLVTRLAQRCVRSL
jgi:hypothetical protein